MTTRIDRWLWAVRLYKTRSAASEACRGGHVRVNDGRVKPSATVGVGDTIRARIGDRERVVEVTGIIEKRVSAAVAATLLVDHSPPPPPRVATPSVPQRERGAGRPTKRERRQLDQARGRRAR